MMDVTEFKTLFGARTLYFAAAFDAFSRLPLAGMTFAAKPGGAAMARLFRQAVTAFGPPKYLITDLGGEFIAGVFRRVVARLGAKQRFSAADNIRATARLERFWKTLKAITRVRLLPPLDRADLEQRLSHALAYYAVHRPHSSLAHRTPAQAFTGVHPTLDLLGRRPRSADQEEADSRTGRLRRRSNSQFRSTTANGMGPRNETPTAASSVAKSGL